MIGIEYASMFAALGTKVTVVERRDRMLEFCDLEVVEALKYHLRDLAVTFRFGETVAAVERRPDGAIAALASGKKIPADTVMYSAGRQGMTDELGLDAAGLSRRRPRPDQGRRVLPAPRSRTSTPSATSSASRRWRRPRWSRAGWPRTTPAASRSTRSATLQPIGIYTIPEISFVGRTEDQLTDDCVPFEVGVSRYRELARGQIIGDSYGMLKLLVSPDDRKLLGVHVFGTGATELVHIGQAVMGCGGTVDYLVDAVFNYPTLAESYKVAALDATNKMRQVERLLGLASRPSVSGQHRLAAAARPAAAAARAGRSRAARPAADGDGRQQLDGVVVPCGQAAGAADSLIGRVCSKVSPQARQRYSYRGMLADPTWRQPGNRTRRAGWTSAR